MGAPPVAEEATRASGSGCALERCPTADTARGQACAGVGVQRSRTAGKAHTGYPKRTADDAAALSARKLPGTATVKCQPKSANISRYQALLSVDRYDI